MEKYINYGLQILTVCQGVWVLTLMGFLMYHYVVKSIKNRFLERNAIYMGVSYCLLTVASMISSLRGYYTWHSVWQIVVIVGYAFGDIIIVRMLHHVTKNEKQKKIIQEYIDALKKKEENDKNK